MKYYKILNQKENHNGLQYQTGLNVDPLPFNPSGNSNSGGIYFASEDILGFLDFGYWIREVTLPDNEEIYENPGNPKKFKAHRVILGKRKKINLEVIKKLVSEGANVQACDDWALRWAAQNGHLEIVQYLVSVGANVHVENDYSLRWAALNRHWKVVKFLISVGANVHVNDDYPLRWASNNGHLEIVKFLVNVGANVHARDNEALRYAEQNDHLEIVKFFKSL